MAAEEPTKDVVVGEEDDDIEDDGYQVSEKVDLDTLKNLDADDDALNRWKESLLAGAGDTNTDDPRNVVVEAMVFAATDRPDMVFDLSTPEGVEALASAPIVIMEGCDYRLRIQFRVQHEPVLGLKYIQRVFARKIKLDTSNIMIGSYAPRAESYVHDCPIETAPSGMMARGSYVAKSLFTDDDKEIHLEWEWKFDIKKKWPDALHPAARTDMPAEADDVALAEGDAAAADTADADADAAKAAEAEATTEAADE